MFKSILDFFIFIFLKWGCMRSLSTVSVLATGDFGQVWFWKKKQLSVPAWKLGCTLMQKGTFVPRIFWKGKTNKQTNSKLKPFIALLNTAKYWGLWGKVKDCKSFLNSICPAKLHEIIVHNLCAGTLGCFSLQDRPNWNLEWLLTAPFFTWWKILFHWTWN